jgi:uncharacterized membrane protein
MEEKKNDIEELEPSAKKEIQDIEELETPKEEKNNDVNYVKKITKYLDDVPDYTKDYGWKEMEDGQIMSILCYLCFLVFVPILTKNKNNYVQFNIKQGLNLFILEVIAAAILSILGAIFIYTITWVVTVLSIIVTLCFFSLSVIGIFNVYHEDAKELPFIGKFKIIK